MGSATTAKALTGDARASDRRLSRSGLPRRRRDQAHHWPSACPAGQRPDQHVAVAHTTSSVRTTGLHSQSADCRAEASSWTVGGRESGHRPSHSHSSAWRIRETSQEGMDEGLNRSSCSAISSATASAAVAYCCSLTPPPASFRTSARVISPSAERRPHGFLAGDLNARSEVFQGVVDPLGHAGSNPTPVNT